MAEQAYDRAFLHAGATSKSCRERGNNRGAASVPGDGSGALVPVDTNDVRPLAEEDRPALCRMLLESTDFPQQLVYLYQRRGGLSRSETFVAWRGPAVVGMLTGSFDSDFHESEAFDSFHLPPAPHAFLDRLHVRASNRGEGIGRALMRHYIAEAAARRCTFIGGSLDVSSDPTSRRAFFERLGLPVRGFDNFGAPVSELL